LIDCVNGTSGESLCAMMLRARWTVTTVRMGAGGSSSGSPARGQPSSYGSRASARNRFAGLNVAPRPLAGGGASFVVSVRRPLKG
jgi:hypothetical protein